ncbi:MAG: hypothetical protein IKJ31_08005 [Bacteroidaceae bacterium]|nr:hypothetical protein [Bacteroidaceae bacterium]
MKKLKLLFILALLISCKTTPDVPPCDVALKVFTALTSGEAQVIKDNIYIEDSIQRKSFEHYLDIAMSSQQYDENTATFEENYTVAKETIDGDRAEVILVGDNPLGQPVRLTVKLLIVDGVWKVNGDHAVYGYDE